MTVLPFYPPPPPDWDAGWARALIEALTRADIDRGDGIRLAQGAGRLTAERWIDGKPIWRAVVPITKTFMEVNGTAIAHGLPSVAGFVRMSGVWVYDGLHYLLPWTDGAVTVSFAANATNVYSNVWGAPSWTLWQSGHVILDYTTT